MSEHGEKMYHLSDNHPSIPMEENRCAFVSTSNSSLTGALTLRSSVPYTAYTAKEGNFWPLSSIMYYTNGVRGVPLSACSNRDFLERPDMHLQAFPGLEKTPKIQIIISWSKYPVYTSRQLGWKRIKSHVTRGELVQMVAEEMRLFIIQANENKANENVAVADAQWKVGGLDGINLNDIFLVEIKHASKSRVQPYFEIVPNH
ncbi:hypothetical protein IEO21_02909 [Rhodonia placenta]|uniref:Uncharacterized protein n=1 Tax=Rhodonia placenta TaxID=104341 RepID=A0A8H7P6R1_9APHY|nr:hypothetical protein IEO21_02909 [Postia placenta]